MITYTDIVCVLMYGSDDATEAAMVLLEEMV